MAATVVHRWIGTCNVTEELNPRIALYFFAHVLRFGAKKDSHMFKYKTHNVVVCNGNR